MMRVARTAWVVALTGVLLGTTISERAAAQPAPIPRAVVPMEAAPEAMSDLYFELRGGVNTIQIAGAEWLQLRFVDFSLGAEGSVTIEGGQDQSQTFTQAQLEAWEGLTAIFNGAELTVTLMPGESNADEPDEIAIAVGEIIIGLPASGIDALEAEAVHPLRELLGPDFQQYIPADEPMPSGEFDTEAICDAADNRVASSHPLVGRIMPIGCTGWLIHDGALLTAGHCIGTATQTIEFNVPASQANGTTVSPPVRDQYRVVAGTIVSANGGVGNDWAVFRILPNTETGLTAHAAQGGAFQLSDTANPANVRITGYGVDGPAPNFGNPPPRNADNQTQQTHAGALTQLAGGGATTGVLRHRADTQGGNSGGPVLVEGGGNLAVGIHTHGGCTAAGGANGATSFRNQALWAAIPPAGEMTYQLHNTGAIWQFTGLPCSGNSCPGWQRLDNNPRSKAIVTATGGLYQLHNNGSIWRSTGTACTGNSCPGWQQLDNNRRTVAIAAAGNHLFQLHNNGAIWRFTGTACSGNSCPGWQLLDNNSRSMAIAAAGTRLYQLHNDGSIWRFTGTACSGNSCPGWERLDNNPRTSAIVAAGTRLYQLHNNGSIWRFTGTVCSGNSCPGWQRLDNNGRTVAIAASGTRLFQLHNSGAIWRFTGTPCSGNSCPGWQRLDNNSRSMSIAASGTELFQLHNSGSIWRYTGTPCSGNSCPGWQRLDNNLRSRVITTAGN